jgi:ribonuclease HII
MPWIVGIDEAGLGPNLGPLVQSAVAARVPDGVGCLWKCLAGGVRRAADPDDGRVLVDDSKLVYSGPHGLCRLERGVVGVVADCRPVGVFLGGLACGSSLDDLAGETWYDAAEPLPIALTPEIALSRPLEEAFAASGVALKIARCVVTPAPKFNRLIDRWGSKAAAMERGVTALLQTVLAEIEDAEPVTIVIDKQGGRNFYAPWFSAAIPEAWIAPVRESALVSEYQVLGLKRDVRLLIYPRAETEALPVALASMLSKYLREVCMRQFNRFWLGHVPGLKPTAGYHVDSRRYYKAIRPAMRKLGIKPSEVWRKR